MARIEKDVSGSCEVEIRGIWIAVENAAVATSFLRTKPLFFPKSYKLILYLIRDN
jgi:hypothetical protein